MEKYKELITAYLAGELDKDESRKIENLVENEQEFSSEFDKLRKTWELYGNLELVQVPEEIKSRIDEEIKSLQAAIPTAPEPVNPTMPRAAIPTAPEPVNPTMPRAAIPTAPEPVNPTMPRSSKRLSLARYMAPVAMAAAILLLMTIIPILDMKGSKKTATEMASFGVENEHKTKRVFEKPETTAPDIMSLPMSPENAAPTSKSRTERKDMTQTEIIDQIRGYINNITQDEAVVEQTMRRIEENLKNSSDPQKELSRLSSELLPRKFQESVDPTREMASRYKWLARTKHDSENGNGTLDGMTTDSKTYGNEDEGEDSAGGKTYPNYDSDKDSGQESLEKKELDDLSEKINVLRRQTERRNSWAANAMEGKSLANKPGDDKPEESMVKNLSQGQTAKEWVFILDLSKSMSELLTTQQIETLPPHLKDKCDNRLDLAKYELTTALGELDVKMKFGVILLTDGGASFVDSLGRIRIYIASEFRTMLATKTNIENVTNKVMSLKPGKSLDKQREEMLGVLKGLEGKNTLAICSLRLPDDESETGKITGYTWLLDLSGTSGNNLTASKLGIRYLKR